METLRDLETDHLNLQLYKTELDKTLDTPPALPQDHSLVVVVGVLGVLVGIVAGLAIH